MTTARSDSGAEIGVDDYIPLDQAPAQVPGRPHRATVWRWSLQGLIRHGEIIRLRTIAAGGRRFTTAAWISDFLGRCNGEAASSVSAGRRQRQAASAMDSLAAMGVGSARQPGSERTRRTRAGSSTHRPSGDGGSEGGQDSTENSEANLKVAEGDDRHLELQPAAFPVRDCRRAKSRCAEANLLAVVRAEEGGE